MKDRMNELARTKELKEGIYNYCDRWCERGAETITTLPAEALSLTLQSFI
jgi:hypothetical protein